ncbi:hypothetical protein AURDEDRAFT_126186 [Auricularia subglabra TFB-10046 SS5]|nr:hypothetical protein AURDEDRAFT_126186 [Auricularia subglabra TFB-10046 SS5]
MESTDPMTRRFQRAQDAAAAAALRTNLSLLAPPEGGNSQRGDSDEDPGHMQLDDTPSLPDDRQQESDTPSNSTAEPNWRDLSHLIPMLTKDVKLAPAALGRIQHYAKAPDDERALMAYICDEVIRAQLKAAADDWEPSGQLKTLLRARVQACLLSPHIPSYKGCLMAHTVALIPATSKSLLGDETNEVHVELVRAFILQHATTYRASMKAMFLSSMSREDTATGKSVLDVTQGWCIGRLCEKLVEGNTIKVTSEIQGRVALIRDVMCCYPAEAQTAAFWDIVDDVLDKQRKLGPAALATDVTNGLCDDIRKYTQFGDASSSYQLVDKTNISSDSLQARADKAMRDYFKMQREVAGKPTRRGKKQKI